jgi:signal transduction histidine kinase
MGNNRRESSRKEAAKLRLRAEVALQARARPSPLHTQAELLICCQELQVHQVELEIQNEELSKNWSTMESCLLRHKQDEKALKNYAMRLIIQEDDLRKKVASELHDDIGQVLAALGLNLANIIKKIPPAGVEDNVRLLLEDSRLLTIDASRSVRNLMMALQPPLLDQCGLPEAIRLHAKKFAQRAEITIIVQVTPDFPRLTRKQETALFYIFQEAVINSAKHANATQVSVSLSDHDGCVTLAVNDNGEGFVPREVPRLENGTGWGLTIMRERARLIHGKFWIESQPGKGTSLRVEVKTEKPQKSVSSQK